MVTRTKAVGWLCAVLLAACAQDVPGPDARLTPLFANAGNERHTIVVNPNAMGNGIAATIQEGIDRVPDGGRVLVKAGVYDEAIVIDKGLTLEAVGDGNAPVVIAPTSAVASVIDVVTRGPVTLRDVTVRVTGANGIRGLGAVDLTVDQAVVVAVNPSGAVNLISVIHDAADGTRARMIVRNSFIDGAVDNGTPPLPQVFGLRAQGDVDALFEHNVLRRGGGACIFAVTRADLGGALNAEILGNHIDQCHPTGRVAAIIVGPLASNLPSATRPVTATGVVKIIGNVFQNSSASCLPASAIAFEVGSGRIERNQIRSYVRSCAIPTGRNLQGAVWAGRRQHPLFPAVHITVRFNDIAGNAFAGLRTGPNQSAGIDASCNYWGASDGPSGAGSGGGDAVLREGDGPIPTFAPWAAAPIAGTGATSC
jgi:hypothetical protein